MVKFRYMGLAVMCLILTAFVADDEKRATTIFMIGDSTMANKDLKGGNPERGWGHVLGGFFTEDIRVDNHARNGRSSKSFRDEGLWKKVLDDIRPGDYVIIQFGHNDEKANPDRHTDPGTTFDEQLSQYVNETRAKGGIPVLMNAIVRRKFYINPVDSSFTDSLTDTHGAYLDSPRKVAQTLNVPFVDMNAITHDLVENLGSDDSKKLFMWIEPKTIPACPDGKQDDTHLNVYGARTIAGLAVDALAKAVPALAPYVRHYDFVVAKDGSGDFFTLQEAVDAVPDFRKNGRTTILLRKGVYHEKVVIPASKINLSLIGQEGAVISGNDFAQKKNRFGEEMSTSGSASCYIYAPDFQAENITFENTAGRVGQAVACFISADRCVFRNCRFLGNQDTLYNYGKHCRQYFVNCYIEGTVDFIFGWSTAVFDRCTICSLGNGYVTAPATEKGEKYGYLFYDCNLTAKEGVDKVYLSRPWRDYAQAVFVRCTLGKHITPAGWNNWNKPHAEALVNYAEYDSRGEGANPSARASFGKQLTTLDGYSMQEVLSGDDGWNPIEQ